MDVTCLMSGCYLVDVWMSLVRCMDVTCQIYMEVTFCVMHGCHLSDVWMLFGGWMDVTCEMYGCHLSYIYIMSLFV